MGGVCGRKKKEDYVTDAKDVSLENAKKPETKAGESPALSSPGAEEPLSPLSEAGGASKVKRKIQRVALIRHGPRVDHMDKDAWFASEDGKAYPYDSPLTPQGFHEAALVGKKIPPVFDFVIASPYLRCIQTAAEIAKVLELPILVDTELGEVFDQGYMPEADGRKQIRSVEYLSDYFRSSYPDVATIGENGQKGGVHIFGKHPEWPEDFEKAKLRYLERFETICKLCAARGANPMIVGHADMITILLQTIGGVMTKSCGYCGWVVGERLAHRTAFDSEWRIQTSREVKLGERDSEEEQKALLADIRKFTKSYRKFAQPMMWPFPSDVKPGEHPLELHDFWEDGLPDGKLLDQDTELFQSSNRNSVQEDTREVDPEERKSYMDRLGGSMKSMFASQRMNTSNVDRKSRVTERASRAA
jgi:broad specificity phosphatase PhoE